MTDDGKQLWRRESHAYTIEIKVGNAWTRHGNTQYQNFDTAKEEAQRMLLDASVSAVQILEDRIVHTHHLAWDMKADMTIRIPKAFEDTGREQACPACQTKSKVATNGSEEFIFCGKCKRALPA